jgi:hypothetical protein
LAVFLQPLVVECNRASFFLSCWVAYNHFPSVRFSVCLGWCNLRGTSVAWLTARAHAHMAPCVSWGWYVLLLHYMGIFANLPDRRRSYLQRDHTCPFSFPERAQLASRHESYMAVGG